LKKGEGEREEHNSRIFGGDDDATIDD